MEELLPDILIKTKLNERTFISRINMILSNYEEIISKEYTKNQFIDGEDSLVITPRNQNGNKNLGVLLFNYKNMHEKVFVELVADTWVEEPATYEVYSNEAKRIMLPILKQYNKEYRSRIRLCIQSKNSLKVRLPKLAYDFFFGFASGVLKKNKLHPTEWKRFYYFIWHCHRRNVKLTDYDLNRLLIENGFDYNNASTLSERYKIIRDFLQLFKNAS